MLRSKRLWWALAVFAVCLFKPASGLTVEVDPYLYRTFRGAFFLDYDRNTTERFGNKTTTSKFAKTFQLDVKAFIVSRWLMTYDTGFKITTTDTDTKSPGQTTENGSKALSYYLRTDLLPKSDIPLTLYGSKNESTTSGQTTSKNTATNYGFRWFARLRTLPVTTISANRTDRRGANTNTSDNEQRVEMRKDIGASKNEAYYAQKTLEDNLSDASSSSTNLRFANKTDLSKTTHLHFGATRNTMESSGSAASSVMEGMSMSLDSRPGENFSQRHSYTSFSNKSGDDKSKGNFYYGNLNYSFSNRLRTIMNLTTTSIETNTASSKNKSESLSTNEGLTYQMTRHLYIGESLSYSSSKSTESTSTAINLTDRTQLTLTADVGYSKKLEWAYLSGTYNFGYTEDKTNKDEGGKGLLQNVSLSLAEIDVNRYAIFNTSISDSRTKNLIGNLNNSSTAFALDAYNKRWRNYVTASAYYNRSDQTSWIAAENQTGESYGFTASTGIIKNTPISVSASRSTSFNRVNGASESLKKGATVRHSRSILAGNFSAGAGYNDTKSDSATSGQSSSVAKNLFAGYGRRVLGGDLSVNWNYDITDDTHDDLTKLTTETTTFDAAYYRTLFKKIAWEAHLTKKDIKINDTPYSSASVTNAIIYSLRSWMFYAQHQYYTSKDPVSGEVVETKLLLSAARGFMGRF